jgi:hypothetical protein
MYMRNRDKDAGSALLMCACEHTCSFRFVSTHDPHSVAIVWPVGVSCSHVWVVYTRERVHAGARRKREKNSHSRFLRHVLSLSSCFVDGVCSTLWVLLSRRKRRTRLKHSQRRPLRAKGSPLCHNGLTKREEREYCSHVWVVYMGACTHGSEKKEREGLTKSASSRAHRVCKSTRVHVLYPCVLCMLSKRPTL